MMITGYSRRLSSLPAIAVLSFALAACSSDKPGDKPTPGNGLDAAAEPDAASGGDGALPDGQTVPDGQTDPDAADAGGSPGLTGELEFNGAKAVLRAADCSFKITDSSGKALAETQSGRPGFENNGFNYGRARNFSPTVYYDPSMSKSYFKYDELEFFAGLSAGEVRPVEGGVAMSCITKNAKGEDGAPIDVVLTRDAHGFVVKAVIPEVRGIIFNSLALKARPGEGFHGSGENFDKLDNRGIIREMQIGLEGQSESSTNEVHVPVPFWVSTEGYGVFTNNRSVGGIDYAARDAETVRTTFWSQQLVHHIMPGNDPMELVERYASIAGKPARVPFWALAPQWWRNENKNDLELLDDVKRARDLDIPSTVVWIDRPWSSYYHNFLFNKSQFPDPEGMFKKLAAQGHRVLLHHSPQMNPPGQSDLGRDEVDEGLYKEFRDNGWLVLTGSNDPFSFPWGGGQGAFIDYTNPAAVARVQELLKRVTALGAIGTKMDWDEYIQPNAVSVRINLKFHNKESILTMKGWYSALYHKTMIEGFDKGLGEPTFHINRSGITGDQVWNTCIWPGDLDNDFSPHTRGPSGFQKQWNVGGMPSAITANITTGMAGYPCFGSDVGGYRGGTPKEEVLNRWMAFGTFNGVMQIGGGGGSHMPWTADSKYSPAAVDIAKKYMRLRVDLFPYIHQQMMNASKTGRPFVRSLWFQFPADPETRKHEWDFMFGPDILAAPVAVEGASAREVYLPAGEWADWWTGEVLQGGKTVSRPAPVDVIPVFVRAGAIIPLADPAIDTLWDATEPGVVTYESKKVMRALVFPRGESANRVWNGVEISSRQSANRVELTVKHVDREPGLPKQINFTPDTITFHVVTAGAFANPAAVKALRQQDGAAAELKPCAAGVTENCIAPSSAPGRLDVVFKGQGTLVLEAK
ncbi:MAG: hypothetical protein GMKNLPBB_00477 [Myxococcota bacterium]|nr:hypothetical protein [Myxococcota bacterium]